MVRPIRTLDEGAQRIGAGDLDQQIDVRTGDELEALADQFNRMTAQLRESYAGLERKVEERTPSCSKSLEQQTAISEILRVISSSPTDVQPVLEAVAEARAHLCDAPLRACRCWSTATSSSSPAARDGSTRASTIRRGLPWPFDRDVDRGRARSSTARRVHYRRRRARCRHASSRSARQQQRSASAPLLAVPLMREARRVGAICHLAPRARPVRARPDRAAEDVRRPGGDRDRERAPVQRDQGSARAADRDQRDPAA